MRPRTFVQCLVLLAVVLPAAAWSQPLKNADTEARIDQLLSRMTLEEKVGQMNQYTSFYDVTGPAPEEGTARERLEQIRSGLVGSMLNVDGAEATRKAQELAVENSRLGIPLIFGFDVIHGHRTIFPIPLAEAASWDLEAIEKSARVAATEAAAMGLHWTFAPMVDVSRDARWGRVMEGAGEDPYLGSRVAVARVRGFQGNDLGALDTVAACAKHLAGYGFAEGGRDYNTVDISDHTLHNVIMPPFKAAAEAGVATFMNAFNEIGGVPATASVRLQREILKGDWGFEGFVISDWGSIGEMVPHGVAADLKEAARMAVIAGNDMDMESRAYVPHLIALVESGQVEESLVDEAVRRILRVKFALGLFDDPYRYSDMDREKELIGHEDHLAAARDVARKSIVLLKNDRDLLPLSRTGQTIAVIGPMAADKDVPLGSWRLAATPGTAVSLLEGIQAALGEGAEIIHAEGPPLTLGTPSFLARTRWNTGDRSGIPAAVEAAREADVVLLTLGEGAFQSGEGRSQVEIGLKGVQMDLLEAVRSANPNVVVVLMTGRPLAIGEWVDTVPAILNVWHLGSQAGHAIADVVFGVRGPSGRLPVVFPRHVGQMPLYYARKKTGRPDPQGDMPFWSHYADAPNDALFPFGYGLTYTTFSYSEPELSASGMEMEGSVDVSVTVRNTGRRNGSEVVQLYVRDLVGSVTRPVKELKGFRKVRLGAGWSQEVTFTLTAQDLAFYTARGIWEAEPGEFEVGVGPNARDLSTARFTLR